nr:MAG TPA: hypothetical protein [Caudoviricetes sp.]
MEKTELFTMAEKLHMEPLMVYTDVRECYGETVVVAGYQTGFALDTDELVTELEDLFAWNTGLVTPVRMEGGTKTYRYELFAPSSWFNKKED